MDYRTYLKNYPDKDGRFGPYGGAYLTDELIPAFEEIADAYQTICHSSQFINELRRIRKEFQGRPTPVYHCERLSKSIGNCQIYLKREDLNHTGAHKLNHCMGEGLLAKFRGKQPPAQPQCCQSRHRQQTEYQQTNQSVHSVHLLSHFM